MIGLAPGRGKQIRTALGCAPGRLGSPTPPPPVGMPRGPFSGGRGAFPSGTQDERRARSSAGMRNAIASAFHAVAIAAVRQAPNIIGPAMSSSATAT